RIDAAAYFDPARRRPPCERPSFSSSARTTNSITEVSEVTQWSFRVRCRDFGVRVASCTHTSDSGDMLIASNLAEKPPGGKRQAVDIETRHCSVYRADREPGDEEETPRRAHGPAHDCALLDSICTPPTGQRTRHGAPRRGGRGRDRQAHCGPRGGGVHRADNGAVGWMRPGG